MMVLEIMTVVEMTIGSAFGYHKLTVWDPFERAGVVNLGGGVKIGVFCR